ncbi:hypothetical protein [Xanthobacter pseudotagetidis]|uniref:hypothetical protein n=1 Tax=Xanthobacter pseudotagetidis TaxID=3119911 RepID=UPI003727EB3A
MNRHVPPHEIQRRDAASFAPRAAPDFKRAARHSTRVRWFRRLLPISLGVSLAVLTAIPFLSSLDLKLELPFDIGHLSLSGTRLTMEEPKLSGFTDDRRGYSVNARTAEQDLTKPDIVDLTDIEARMELADKGWTTVIAKTGTMNVKTQFITLGGGVDLAMKGGYAGKLKDADVDVKAGTIVTQKPVEFTYQEAKLVADSLTVTDRGAKALFVGNVQLDFLPSALSSGQNVAPPAAGQEKPQPAKGSPPAPAVASGTHKPAAVATAPPPPAATPALPAGALGPGAVSSAFAPTETALPAPFWSLPASVAAAPPNLSAAGAMPALPPPAPLPPRRPVEAR